MTKIRVRQFGKTTYRIYSDGRIWSYWSRKFLKGYIDYNGYRVVHVGNKSVKLHRLLLSVFKRASKTNEQSCHRDGNPANNNLKNLYWGTGKQNWKDRKRHKRISSGRLKLTKKQVDQIRDTPYHKHVIRDLAIEHNVSIARIAQLREGAVIQSHLYE